MAEQRQANLIIHTGDLLNFPSPKAAAYTAEVMSRSGVPFLFTCGKISIVARATGLPLV